MYITKYNTNMIPPYYNDVSDTQENARNDKNRYEFYICCCSIEWWQYTLFIISFFPIF